MNGHFSVINKRGLTVAGVFMGITIAAFLISLFMRIQSGSRLWLIPIIFAAVLFLFAIRMILNISSEGIDVKDGMVILPDLENPARGKQPKFSIADLKGVELRNGEGKTLDPENDNLLGGRVVFSVTGGKEEIYYPIAITAKQYRDIHDGMLAMAKEAGNRGKK
ncbi:MAG: hypothetical protein ACI4LP_00495 [Anaerovoracaceae bacterium]